MKKYKKVARICFRGNLQIDMGFLKNNIKFVARLTILAPTRRVSVITAVCTTAQHSSKCNGDFKRSIWELPLKWEYLSNSSRYFTDYREKYFVCNFYHLIA